MNMVLFQLYKRFGHNLYACRAGFKGLINNDIIPISEFKPLGKAKQAGSIIKCSRCPEFKTEAGFNQGLENAKRFDVVVVLGLHDSVAHSEGLIAQAQLTFGFVIGVQFLADHSIELFR